MLNGIQISERDVGHELRSIIYRYNNEEKREMLRDIVALMKNDDPDLDTDEIDEAIDNLSCRKTYRVNVQVTHYITVDVLARDSDEACEIVDDIDACSLVNCESYDDNVESIDIQDIDAEVTGTDEV